MAVTALKAGVIGLGVGERHVQACQAVSGVEVAAVCDLDAARAEDIGARYGVGRRVTDWRAIVEDPDVDIVSICSYDDAHGEQVIAALENGKHVFIEKPMCLYPEEADAIRKAFEAHPDLKLSANLPLRTCPRFR